MENPILLNLPNCFQSERLDLRSYQVGDGEEYYNLLHNNRDHLLEEVEEINKLTSVEKAEIYTRTRMIEWISRKRFVIVIIEKKSSQMIGQLWIEPNWKKDTFEIGYFLAKEKTGKGLITEAVKASMKFLHTNVEVRKFVIMAKSNNIKSWKVAERCGFKKEGELRLYSEMNDGTIVNQVIYGLLKDEYIK